MILAPLDLSRWTPSNEEIPIVRQLEILASLREWLSHQRIRTDIGRPSSMNSDERRVYLGCANRRLREVAFCGEHFDRMLLARAGSDPA